MAALFSVAALAILLIWKFSQQKAPPPLLIPLHTIAKEDIIPPGIVVTESTTAVSQSSVSTMPGDSMLAGYGNPKLTPQSDIVLLAHAISNFLIIAKQATDRPLSANEEWSAALRGKRPGIQPWISESSPVLDRGNHLIDRWGIPLHFHALGGKQWEIRSAGPDHKLWTADDLLAKISG